MPLIEPSYRPPLCLRSGHLQTIAASSFRRSDPGLFTRERIDTPDGDFLDLDWTRTGNGRVAVLSHGLEGNSRRPYMVGMARMLSRCGWDVVAWNERSCSGEMNRTLRMYHNGSTDDLHLVVRHALAAGAYDALGLVGFSLGANLSLLYLGQQGDALDPRVRAAAAFSAPCDLAASADALASWQNRLYMVQFLRSLHEKVRLKMAALPGRLSDEGYGRIRTFREFDDRYTAPLHGFRDAADYYEQCSSGTLLHRITVPALIVNALDDPFLAGGCYPAAQAAASRHVHFEMPASGGHVGFMEFAGDGAYWSERRAAAFLGGAG